jgi:hypothetical protein
MTTGADWLDSARRLLDVVRAEAGPAPDASGDAHGGEDCRWCPVCQAAAVVRGERPEVTAALADLLTTTAEALRTFAETPPAAAAPEDPVADGSPGEEQPPVQRIDIA